MSLFGCTCICTDFQTSKSTLLQNHKITLTPPSPPTYSINYKELRTQYGAAEQEVDFIPITYKPSNLKYPWISIRCFQIQHYDQYNTITIILVKNLKKSNIPDKLTIIYSHGKEEDLGTTIGFLVDFSTQTCMDIISYDYSGFGCSQGELKEKNLGKDIERVLDFTTTTLRIPTRKIVLFGRNVGAIPSLCAIENKSFSGIRGLILVSPELNEFSLRKIWMIECNVFVIHGLKDDFVLQEDCVEIGKVIKNYWSWYPSKGTHDNIVEVFRNKFYKKIKLFMEMLQGGNSGRKLTEDSISNIDLNVPSFNINNPTKRKKKEIRTITNYVQTPTGQNSNALKSSSVRMFVIEDNTNQSLKCSQKYSSITSNSVKNNEEDDDEEENIFELNPQSLHLNNENINNNHEEF